MTERKVSSERVSEERLRDLKERAGLKYMPTQMTYEARKAANSLPSEINEHFFARNWEDKPHRVVFDLCEEIERLSELLALRSSVKTVGVKELEWQPIADMGADAEEATGGLRGAYRVFQDEDSAFGAVFSEWGGAPDDFCSTRAKTLGRFYNWYAAKAAAQADYEQRILSAIEATSEGEGVVRIIEQSETLKDHVALTLQMDDREALAIVDFYGTAHPSPAASSEVTEERAQGVCAWPKCTCAQMCDEQKFPTLQEAYEAAITAAEAFCYAADVEETNWTGWGDQVVPASATERRVKAYQAFKAIRDADPPRFRALTAALKGDR